MQNINSNFLIKNTIIITPFKTIEGHNLFIEHGKITRIVRKNVSIPDTKNFKILDLESKDFILPKILGG